MCWFSSCFDNYKVFLRLEPVKFFSIVNLCLIPSISLQLWAASNSLLEKSIYTPWCFPPHNAVVLSKNICYLVHKLWTRKKNNIWENVWSVANFETAVRTFGRQTKLATQMVKWWIDSHLSCPLIVITNLTYWSTSSLPTSLADCHVFHSWDIVNELLAGCSCIRLLLLHNTIIICDRVCKNQFNFRVHIQHIMWQPSRAGPGSISASGKTIPLPPHPTNKKTNLQNLQTTQQWIILITKE